MASFTVTGRVEFLVTFSVDVDDVPGATDMRGAIAEAETKLGQLSLDPEDSVQGKRHRTRITSITLQDQDGST